MENGLLEYSYSEPLERWRFERSAMSDSIKGSVDILDPEFLHSIGIAVATFGHLEGILCNAFFAAKHQSQDYASYPDSAIEIHDTNFSSKIDKVFKELNAHFNDPKSQGLIDLQDEFHKARQARNFLVHGIWKKGAKEGSYRCVMMDRSGQQVVNEVDRNVILSEATRAEHLMIQLKSLLIAKGLYPKGGPKVTLAMVTPTEVANSVGGPESNQ